MTTLDASSGLRRLTLATREAGACIVAAGKAPAASRATAAVEARGGNRPDRPREHHPARGFPPVPAPRTGFPRPWPTLAASPRAALGRRKAWVDGRCGERVGGRDPEPRQRGSQRATDAVPPEAADAGLAHVLVEIDPAPPRPEHAARPVGRKCPLPAHASAAGSRVVIARRSALGAPFALAAPALAQDAWPTRPVRLVVPFAPGGSVDILARTVAPALQERLGQAVTVENKPGAGSALANGLVAGPRPDGYTRVATGPVRK